MKEVGDGLQSCRHPAAAKPAEMHTLRSTYKEIGQANHKGYDCNMCRAIIELKQSISVSVELKSTSPRHLQHNLNKLGPHQDVNSSTNK